MASKVKIPSKIRNAVYTLNNYTSEHVSQLKHLPSVYHVMGFELGASGTPHIQGLIIFENPRSFKAVRKLLFNSHIESMKGTHLQASTYCKKDGDFYETGTLPNPGKRNDIDTMVTILRDKYQGNSTQMFVDMPSHSVRYWRFYDRISVKLQSHRSWRMEILWLWGPTGCGKSKWAFAKYPEAYSKNLAESFWEQYEGEETVIFDDLRPHHYPDMTELLRLFDSNPIFVKIKCKSAKFRSKRIVITSDRPPEHFYNGDRQFWRRVTTVMTEKDFKGGDSPIPPEA